MQTTHPDSQLRRAGVFAELFSHFLSVPAEFDVVKTNNSGALTIADMAGGGYGALTTGGTTPADNNGVFLATQGEVFKFGTGRFVGKSRMKWTEAAANNIMPIGFMNAPTENTFLGDDGAGPPANYYGACIYKVDGGTTWIVEASQGTTQQTLDTGIEVTGAETDFEIEVLPVGGGGSVEVVFKIGGVEVRYPSIYGSPVFKPEIQIASATEMKGICGHKTGGATELITHINFLGFEMPV